MIEISMRTILTILLFFTFSVGNCSLAQEETPDLNHLKIDTSKITLMVNEMRGCVVSPVNYMEFRFYPDSTTIKFCPSLERSMLGGEDEFKYIVVPVNLWDRIQRYRETLEKSGRKIDMTKGFHYSIEFYFDWFVGYSEYRITAEEHQILSDWFDEFNATK